jgi:hypothetical protein
VKVLVPAKKSISRGLKGLMIIKLITLNGKDNK